MNTPLFTKTFINSAILKGKFKEHQKIKKELLSLQKDAPGKPSVLNDAYYKDNITFTDWFHGSNLKRPWVKFFLQHFVPYWGSMATELGYGELRINKVWFQRYKKSSIHNWHVHGANYTGVYYLDFPKGSAATEFIDPKDNKTTFFNNIEEGDIIFFPCYVIHRSGLQDIDKQKTIISWNLDFVTVRKDLLHISDEKRGLL